MDKRILGIDLSDMGTLLAYYGEEECWSFPTVICRLKNEETWLVGEEAYEKTLDGSGIITDKLLALAVRKGSATLNDVKYTGRDLLRQFLKSAIEKTVVGDAYPEEIVVCIPEIDKYTVHVVRDCLTKLGYRSGRVHVISRAESFIYYVMSQSSELRANQVAMFTLEDVSLTYYELKIQHKAKKVFVYADKKPMDESFNLEILSSASGAKMADRILSSCAERLMKNKIYSSVILSGKGFETQDWAPNLMRYLCTRRKVFVDREIFARGAGYRGCDFSENNSIFSFTCICDSRLEASVFLDISKDDRVMSYPLCGVGDTWYDIDRTVRLIPVDINELELNIIPMSTGKRKVVRIPLDFLPKRPRKTTAILLNVTFSDEHRLLIDIRDAGFGDLFPATDARLRREVHLWD